MYRRKVIRLVTVIAVTIGLSTPVRVSAATTIGPTDLSRARPDSTPGGYKFGSLVMIGDTVTVTAFHFYVAGGAAPQDFTPVIYDTSSNGQPRALRATGGPVTVAAKTRAGWTRAVLPSTRLGPGAYLVGVISGPSSSGALLFYSPGGPGSFWNEDDYLQPDGAWGPVRPDDVQWAFLIEHEAPTAPGPVIPNPTPAGGGCPAFPAFPDRSCTGVPAHVQVSDYTGTEVTADNTVISGVRVGRRVTVRANNVTFRNCLISPSDPVAIAVEPGFVGLTIENCTFKTGSLIPPVAGLVLRRVLVAPDTGAYRPDGIVIGFSSTGGHGRDILIEDSYIAPQWGDPGDHTDAIQFWGFGTVTNVVLRHNYIDSTNANPNGPPGGAGAFFADGTYENVIVERNYFANLQGDTYIHLRLLSDRPTTGHVVRGNRFDRHGVPVDLFRMTPAVWEDNRFAETGQLIPQPAARG